MTFTHTTGRYNVEATLTAWLYTQLVANQPASVASVVLNVDAPDEPLTPPCWSLHFLGADEDERGFEGGHVGGSDRGSLMYGIMEVNAWVSRAAVNWRAQKAQMLDAVTKALNSLYSAGAGMKIKDFYTSASAPQDTTYRVTIRGWALRQPPVDPNPDIERERVLIYFQWIERV